MNVPQQKQEQQQYEQKMLFYHQHIETTPIATTDNNNNSWVPYHLNIQNGVRLEPAQAEAQPRGNRCR
jgi:hypothetical protein